MKKNADQPAFASDFEAGNAVVKYSGTIKGGLTKREYFAVSALVGILHGIPPGLPGDLYYEKICEKAVKMADELLKQLES